MTSFYEAFERERSSDIKHHGVKGMKWGVRTQKPYEPVATRNYNQNDIDYSSYSRPVSNVQDAPPKKVMSTKKKVLIGLAIGANVAGIVAGLVLGVRDEKKRKMSPDSILTGGGKSIKDKLGGLA